MALPKRWVAAFGYAPSCGVIAPYIGWMDRLAHLLRDPDERERRTSSGARRDPSRSCRTASKMPLSILRENARMLIGLVVVGPHEPPENDDQDQQCGHDRHRDRDSQGVAHLAESVFVGEDREESRRPARSAASQQVDQTEGIEGEDQREQARHHDHVAEAWQGDVAELRPAIRAVDRCGVIELVVDCLEPGQQDDGEERNAFPDIDRDHGGQRKVIVPEPDDSRRR